MPCPAPPAPAGARSGQAWLMSSQRALAAAPLRPACQSPPSPTPGQPGSIPGGSREAPPALLSKESQVLRGRMTHQSPGGPSPAPPWPPRPSQPPRPSRPGSSLGCAQEPARLKAVAPTVPSACSAASGWNVTSCTISPAWPSPPLPWLRCFQRSYHALPVSCVTAYTCLFSIHAPLCEGNVPYQHPPFFIFFCQSSTGHRVHVP